jgi:hypothetical protein
MGIQEEYKCNRSSREIQILMVAKGYSQVDGVNFGEIFSFVEKLLMSLAATFDMEIEQVDVKTMFLHGNLEGEIYMK